MRSNGGLRLQDLEELHSLDSQHQHREVGLEPRLEIVQQIGPLCARPKQRYCKMKFSKLSPKSRDGTSLWRPFRRGTTLISESLRSDVSLGLGKSPTGTLWFK